MHTPDLIHAMAEEIVKSGIPLADHRRLIFHLQSITPFTAKQIGQHFDAALKKAMGNRRAA